MAATTSPPDFGPVSGHSIRRAAYLTAFVGILFVALFLASYALGSTIPGPTATDADIADFYGRGGSRRVILVSLYLMPFAGIAFLWFIVALRQWIAHSARRREDVLFSNVQLVSGIVFIALAFAGAAANSVMAASVEFAKSPVEPGLSREFPQLGHTLLLVFAVRMAAMFVFTTSNIGRASGVLPPWFTYLGYAVGLFLLLSATFNSVLTLVFPLWVLVLCLFLLERARHIPPDAAVEGTGAFPAATE